MLSRVVWIIHRKDVRKEEPTRAPSVGEYSNFKFNQWKDYRLTRPTFSAKEVPHCNKFGQTHYCEAAENATVNGTLTMIENSSTTSCHLPQATHQVNGTRLNATHTNTTSLPTVTKQSELSKLPITNLTESAVQTSNSVPTVGPSNMGDRKGSSITVILGGLMIAFVGALCL